MVVIIKKLVSLMCTISIICLLFAVSAEKEKEQQVDVYINGVKIELYAAPQVTNEQTMVPLRVIAENLGATVTWDETEQAATITKDSDIIKIQINNLYMNLNDKIVVLGSPPILIDNKLFVPIRAISEGLNIKTEKIWEDTNKYSINLTPKTDAQGTGLTFGHFFDERCNDVLKDYNSGKFGDEMYFLASGGHYGGNGDIAIYIKNNNVNLIFYQYDNNINLARYNNNGNISDRHNGRYKTRTLSKKEFQAFIAFIQDNKIDSLTDWDTNYICDGIEYQYMHCSKNKTTTFYINNPGEFSLGGDIYALLVNKFFDMTKTGDFEVHYKGETENNIKILIKREDYKVKSVWKKGNDFRVLISDEKTPAYQSEKLTWHKFRNNRVGKVVQEPKDTTMQSAWDDINEEFNEDINNYPWEIRWNNFFVRALGGGICLTRKNEKPIIVAGNGLYAKPIVIPQTDWVVCAKAESDRSSYSLVKINLKTFMEFVLDLKPAEVLYPLAYINNKLLIVRNEDKFLYDIATDKMEKVDGDFSGLTDIRERFLQKTSNPNEYFAVKEQHILGKINIETFKFTSIADFEGLYFDSMNAWVDENNNKVYIVANNDLLEISLPLN